MKDPTRTTTLRRSAIRTMKGKWNKVSPDNMSSSIRQVANSKRQLDKWVMQGYLSGVRKGFRKVKHRLESLKERDFIGANFGGGRSRTERLIALQNKVRGFLDSIVSETLVNAFSTEKTPERAIEIAFNKTKAMINTSIVAAHSEGVLDAMVKLGIEEVGVDVEWMPADNPCKLCKPLEGVIMTVEEARDMFPRHINCKCSLTPSFEKYSKRKLTKAIKASIRVDDTTDWGMQALNTRGRLDKEHGHESSEGYHEHDDSIDVTTPKHGDWFSDSRMFKVPGAQLRAVANPMAPTDWSVVETLTDEDRRRQGLASKLIDKMKETLNGSIGAQVSSEGSLKLYWNKGFRYGGKSLEEALDYLSEFSSVNLIYGE